MSASRSFGLFFFFFHLSPDLSFPSHLRYHLTQMSYKRSSGCIFNTAFSLPQFHLSLNLIQPRQASSTRLGYSFHIYPSPPSSVMISISPDKRQAFVWAFFSPDLSILPHPVQANYKRSPGYIFICWTFSLTVSCSPDEQRASSNTHLGYFFLLTLCLYLPFRLLVKIATCHYTVRKSIL